jgi:hypothetical protein
MPLSGIIRHCGQLFKRGLPQLLQAETGSSVPHALQHVSGMKMFCKMIIFHLSTSGI